MGAAHSLDCLVEAVDSLDFCRAGLDSLTSLQGVQAGTDFAAVAADSLGCSLEAADSLGCSPEAAGSWGCLLKVAGSLGCLATHQEPADMGSAEVQLQARLRAAAAAYCTADMGPGDLVLANHPPAQRYMD